MSYFFAYGQVSQKNIISYFHKKNSKYVLTSILALITSLLKSWESGQYFKQNPKNILFCFSIGDYEFIHKTYSRY
jgi:hypothetical protein